MRTHTSKNPSYKFTMIELIVVIAVICILVSILLPVLGKAKEAGSRTLCQNNLKGVGYTLLCYTADYDGYYPPYYLNLPLYNLNYPSSIVTWPKLIDYLGYVNNRNIFYCPSVKDEISAEQHWSGSMTYGLSGSTLFNYKPSGSYSFAPARTTSFKNPSSSVCAADSRFYDKTYMSYHFYPFISTSGGQVYQWHRNSANILWIDGHVSNIKAPNNLIGSMYATGQPLQSVWDGTPSCWDRE